MPEVWVNADQWIEQAEEYLRERGRIVVDKARHEALEHIARLAKRLRKLDSGSGTVELRAVRLALWLAVDEFDELPKGGSV